jgi:copper(I)-binding protein
MPPESAVILLRASLLVLLSTLFAGPLVHAGSAADVQGLRATGGWVRETPPGRSVAAGYVTLENAGETTAVLIGARSPVARVEMHSMRMVEGMMRMRPLDRLEIPAGEHASLAPFFDVDAMRAGTTVEFELLFEDGSTLPLALPVRRSAPAGD